MGTSCAPLVADLFFFFCFVMSETSCCLFLAILKLILLNHITLPPRNLDCLLNSDNSYFQRLTGQIYPTKIQINKANSLDTEAPFLDLDLSITND